MTWSTLAGILILLAVLDAAGFVLWYACSWPASQALGPALVRGRPDIPRVALTFDDGPLPPYTEWILDILRERQVRATFFVCGRNAEQYPEIVRRIHSEGHTIGNHTWSHPYLFFLPRVRIAEEIDRTQEAIGSIIGRAPRLFRPPYGARWFGLYPVLRQRKMDLVQWSVSGYDWKLGAEGILAAVRAGLRPGAIILLHDGHQAPGGYLQRLFNGAVAYFCGKQPQPSALPKGDRTETVKVLSALIDCVRGAGLEFVSVQDFLAAGQEASPPAPAK